MHGENILVPITLKKYVDVPSIYPVPESCTIALIDVCEDASPENDDVDIQSNTCNDCLDDNKEHFLLLGVRMMDMRMLLTLSLSTTVSKPWIIGLSGSALELTKTECGNLSAVVSV